MKIKKALACVLAVAMVISLMPAMAFASTNNTVSSVAKVEADDPFTTTLNLEVSSVDPVAGSFDIELNNAEWNVTGGADTAVAVATTSAFSAGSTTAVAICYVTPGAITTPTVAGITASAISVTENTMRVKLESANVLVKDTVIKLSLNLKAKNEADDVTVSILDAGAKISSGTYTVATVASSGTVASVVGSSVKKVTADGTYVGNTVKISEVAATSVKNDKVQGIRLVLPKKYNWVSDNTSVAAMFAGDMIRVTGAGITASTAAISSLTTGSAIWNTDDIVYSVDENKMDVYFLAKGDGTSNEILQITPKFTVDSAAATGDVTLTISNIQGTITSVDDLVIAQNIIENVEVKSIEKLPTIKNALLKNDSKDQYVYVVLKENVADALTTGKTVKFTFPEEVQIVSSVAIKYVNVKNATKDSNYNGGTTVSFAKDSLTEDASVLKWSAVGTAAVDELTFRIPVTVEAGFTGDIEVTVEGAKAGIEEQTVVVGTAVSAVEVEGTSTDVKAGIQKQTLGDIIIKETEKAALIENNRVRLTIPDLGGLKISDAKIEVTEGDIEVGKLVASGEAIEFRIDSKSTKASTIKISGLNVTLSRVPAEGAYDLRIAGNALIENGAYNDGDFKDYAAKIAGYVNVVTPADSTTVSEKVDAKFVIGEASYTNNGEATEMDAAAYIDKNNRTMVPIRYVANACGISENDIRWEQNTQTAIINGLNTVVTVKMGSNKLQTSTGEITMDTVAVNNNGRIYVPVRYIANALGANVSWDAATKTVTLTK